MDNHIAPGKPQQLCLCEENRVPHDVLMRRTCAGEPLWRYWNCSFHSGRALVASKDCHTTAADFASGDWNPCHPYGPGEPESVQKPSSFRISATSNLGFRESLQCPGVFIFLVPIFVTPREA
jgi:hypothetical protein